VNAHADGDVARGEQRFQDCAACHATQPGVNNVGPSLHGVFERKAATVADFRYSPALKRSGITWTAEAIDAFLADPQKVVPNNRVVFRTRVPMSAVSGRPAWGLFEFAVRAPL